MQLNVPPTPQLLLAVLIMSSGFHSITSVSSSRWRGRVAALNLLRSKPFIWIFSPVPQWSGQMGASQWPSSLMPRPLCLSININHTFTEICCHFMIEVYKYVWWFQLLGEKQSAYWLHCEKPLSCLYLETIIISCATFSRTIEKNMFFSHQTI